MATYDVDVNKLRKDAQLERVTAGKIRSLTVQISQIAGNLAFESSVRQKIQSSLKAIADSSMSLSQKVTVLSEALETIALYYEQTERGITGQGNLSAHSKQKGVSNSSDNSIGEAIHHLAENIKELKETLGLDSACAYSDDPVNLSNGNYVYEKSFFNYDTLIPMNLRFFYNALGKVNGAYGKGWRHNFETCLLINKELYSVLFEDGSERLFRRNGVLFEPYAGTEGRLSGTKNGFVYTDPENIRFCFNQDGKLVCEKNQDDWSVKFTYLDDKLSEVTCTDGIALSFCYTDDGRLVSVTDQAGRTVGISYTGDLLTSFADPSGRSISFQYDENDRLCAIVLPDGTMGIRNWYDEKNRTVRQLFPDGGVVQFTYSDEKNMVSMTRQNGSKVHYFHDEKKRNIRNVYPDGEESFTYDSENHKTSYTDKNGNRTLYSYDGQGRLAGFTNALGHTVAFRYTASGQLEEFSLDDIVLGKSVYDDKHHQISYTNSNGNASSFEYDEKGRVSVITHEDGSNTILRYDDIGNVIYVKDPRTGSTVYEYDNCRRVISSVDALGRKTTYEYDDSDQLILVTNPSGNSRSYQYDVRGNLSQVRDFNGGITRFYYDECGRTIQCTDPDGHTTSFEYDSMGNVVRKVAADGAVTEYAYDSENHRIMIRDPMGGTEKAVYDPMGNLIERVAQDNGIFRFSYDALNRPVSVTDPAGRTRSASYDRFGNVTEIHYEDGTSEHYEYDTEGNKLSFTDVCGYTQWYSYDALGDLTEVRDDKGVLAKYEYLPGGRIKREYRQDGSDISYSYDAIGNIIRMEDTANGVWNLTYDCLDRIIGIEHEGGESESYEYDLMGNITAVTDGEGHRTSYSYSRNGSLLQAETAEGTKTSYTYDPCYRLISVVKTERGLDAERLNTINRNSKKPLLLSYTRDLNGNVLSVQEADGGITEYAYDACGRIVWKKDADGYELHCSYEKDGTEKEIHFSDGRKICYQYDALKRLKQIEDWLGTSSFKLDAAGRLLSAEDPYGNQMSCKWSDRGDCVELLYPDGKKAEYGYDEKGRLSFIDLGCAHSEYTYYNNGRLKSRKLPEGLSMDYDYDAAGRIRTLTSFLDDRKLSTTHYDYDGCGRKSHIHDLRGDGNSETALSFSYSPAGCLTTVKKNGSISELYSYDGFGNRLSAEVNGVRTDYNYDGAGRLISSLSGSTLTDYRYDRRGNLTEKRVNGIEKLSLSFGALNRLEKAVSQGYTAIYQYDGLGRLVGKSEKIDEKKTDLMLFHDYREDSEKLLSMSSGHGLYQDYFWDRQPFYSTGSSGEIAFLLDERLSMAFSMRDQRVTRHNGFHSFGECAFAEVSSESLLNPFGFGSYLKDPVTGFLHGGAREYDPSTGRFISRDPDGGELMRPITLNPFIYCMSDPLNYYDPTGAIVAWLAGGIVGAVGNVCVKFAGDVIKSVKNGKWSGSSWQSYVGSAAGGFVEGSVLMVAGPTAAGAAGAATETLITNGLNMATGVEGYRKEDGYNVGKLLGETAISGATGAATGFVFGKVGEHMTKYVRIPGITKGKGSMESVWKQVVTKAQKNIIKNISLKTVYKGIAAYGLNRGLDKMISQGIEEAKNTVKDFAKESIKKILEAVMAGGAATEVNKAVNSLTNMTGGHMSAACPAAGI